jgi:hypothetical protein
MVKQKEICLITDRLFTGELKSARIFPSGPILMVNKGICLPVLSNGAGGLPPHMAETRPIQKS